MGIVQIYDPHFIIPDQPYEPTADLGMFDLQGEVATQHLLFSDGSSCPEPQGSDGGDDQNQGETDPEDGSGTQEVRPDPDF